MMKEKQAILVVIVSVFVVAFIIASFSSQRWPPALQPAAPDTATPPPAEAPHAAPVPKIITPQSSPAESDNLDEALNELDMVR